MIESALELNRVVRLVGGDPFTFDHASEEIDALLEHNIPFQVVPGIPAATACGAYAGIPLTDTRFSQSVQFLDAHPRSGQLNLDWSSLSRANQTLVFYRAKAAIDIICKELISHGLDAHTPAALVERGTYADQRVIVGDLTDLPAKVRDANIKPPTVVIIGETVGQRDQLAWFR
jgi:uroporphyrin-III C-methyltransferase/precorrin-2 dehydrogenase/sirohydrochlorin ferrochelatase